MVSVHEKHRIMASLYHRKDSKELWLACYPSRAACWCVRARRTEDPREAGRILEKVKLMIALERLKDVPVPEKFLARFEGLPRLMTIESAPKKKNRITLLLRYAPSSRVAPAGNVHAALNNKLSQLRQFFGSALIDEIDPARRKPPSSRRREPLEPCSKDEWMTLLRTLLLTFLHERNTDRAASGTTGNFHELFRVALVNGFYVPANPYAPNPASELPSYKGTDAPITVLSEEEVEWQYAAVASDPKILFGCQIMIEGGFRLHEALALRRASVARTSPISGCFCRSRLPGVALNSKLGNGP